MPMTDRTRREVLAGAAAAASAPALAGCLTYSPEPCQTGLANRSSAEDHLIASVSFERDSTIEEADLQIQWWDVVGTEANPAYLVAVYNEEGKEISTISPDSGDRESSRRIDAPDKNPELRLQVFDADGALLEERTVEVDC